MEFPQDFRLYLASQSPRRHSLLSDIGVPFTVATSDAVERTTGRSVRQLATQNALAKVQGAHLPDGDLAGAFALGTDTLVSVGRRIMGKPESAQEATEMLEVLSGRKHQVVSGVALTRIEGEKAGGWSGRWSMRSARTEVMFAKLDGQQIAAYVESGEWRGKAGGYAVQGAAALFVSGISGEYSNVVGLPLHLLCEMFRKLGFDLLRRNWI